MSSGDRGSRLFAILLAGAVICSCLTPGRASGAEYGRVSGTVVDPQGNPLMGATVLLMGPEFAAAQHVEATVERVITDAHGRFAVERLVPGWYSLRVTSPTRLPILRNGVRVEAGQTSRQKFVLSDIFSPVRFQVPSGNVTTWGDDWKWVLRSSAATRPILRYQESAATQTVLAGASKMPAQPGQYFIGMLPGSTRRGALASEAGLGSVLAYVRALSDDADLLVAGSMGAAGLQASSLVTAIRRNIVKGDPQEITLVVHQLDFSDGLPIALSEARGGLARAQGVVVSYTHTRRLTDSLTMTTGLQVDYLNATRDVLAARPRIKLEYRVNPSTVLAFRYRTVRLDGSGTLLDRIGMLTAFPRVTLRGNRLRLEELNHSEVGLRRSLSKTSRIEIAAFHDYFQNAAVWGSGEQEAPAWLAGNLLPNAASDGFILNAGNFHSSGMRTSYSRSMGEHVETVLTYSFGEALGFEAPRNVQGGLRPERSQSVAGKISARVPISKTQITTSYLWLQRGRVTGVDPYGQASLELQPFLGLQIRQPLPTLAFFPARIEALADFRNLLGEGYVPMSRADGKPFLLTSAYRSFRGGFSVQF